MVYEIFKHDIPGLHNKLQLLHRKVSATEIHQPPSSNTQNLAFPGATVGDETLDCRQKPNQGRSGEPLRSSISQNQTLPCEEEPQFDQGYPPKRRRTDVDKLPDNIHLAVPVYQTSRDNATAQRHHRSSAEPLTPLNAKGPTESWHEQTPSQFTDPQIQPQDNALSLMTMESLPERENPPHRTKRMEINSIIDPLPNPQNLASSRN